MNAYTIERVAEMWHCKPGVIRGLIERGEIKTRRDGQISERALRATIKRQTAFTARYLALKRGGMSADMALKQARREYQK